MTRAALVTVVLWASLAWSQPQFRYDEETRVWTGENGALRVTFQLAGGNRLALQGLEHLKNGDSWTPPPGEIVSPVRLQVDGAPVDGGGEFLLVDQSVVELPRGGVRQALVWEDSGGSGRIALELEMYGNYPVLRYRVRYRNLRSQTVWVTGQDFLPWRLDAGSHRLRSQRVRQWSAGGVLGNFETEPVALAPGGAPAEAFTGAYGQYCTWLAVRDENERGLFAGWEFNGRAVARVARTRTPPALEFSSEILELHHPLERNQEYVGPYAFLGLFRGLWDEAGYQTQRFAEDAIARPLPDDRFPYMMWDSWGYGENISEAELRRNALVAARLGVEVFVVDLGWARRIGDWHADPRKFPSGLRALSDYVHSLGMKFGLHFALAEAAPDSPVLLQNADWSSSHNYEYFGGVSLCLSHRPVRQWLVAEAVRMIDEYNLDWILQDGENMVKECTKETHTHDPQDSNYSNAVDGLDWVVSAVQRQRPNVLWENCEDGGNMMTFNMVRRYVTSIGADNSGALTTRQAVFGATYPFSPRYVDGYMPEDRFLTTYITRSYMFGGPWILMNRLTQMSAADLDVLAREIPLYKRLRSRLRTGKVFHLTARPTSDNIAAIESYQAATDSAVVFLYRDAGGPNLQTIPVRGFRSERLYRITFEGEAGGTELSGEQLLAGVPVAMPAPFTARIMYVQPVE